MGSHGLVDDRCVLGVTEQPARVREVAERTQAKDVVGDLRQPGVAQPGHLGPGLLGHAQFRVEHGERGAPRDLGTRSRGQCARDRQQGG